MGAGRRRPLPAPLLLLPPLLLLLPPAALGACSSPTRLSFAKLSEEDETKNFYAVGVTVSYICRAGYEKSSEGLLTSTCLENTTWTEVPELCQKKSCGVPAHPEHGKVVATDHLFGARGNVVCDEGYRLAARSPLVHCLLRGGGVAWSHVPACRAIACAPPPAIPNGTHNGSSVQEFGYHSAVTYTCDFGFYLTGNDTLHCTDEKKMHGVWSGSPPECRAIACAPPPAIPNGTHNGSSVQEFGYHSAVTYTCDFGFYLTGNDTLRCTDEKKMHGVWSGSPPECRAFSAVVETMAVTDPPKLLEDETAENRRVLVFILVPSCIGICILLVWVLMRWKRKKQQCSYETGSPKRGTKGMDLQMSWRVPVPRDLLACPHGSCHVCPRCEAGLHAHLDGQPCTTCRAWLRARLGPAPTYSALSIGDAGSATAAGTSSADKAPALPSSSSVEEATAGRREAEQPGTPESADHACPTCEAWSSAHLGGRSATVPVEPPRRTQTGAMGPVCPRCADRLHLALVHSAAPGGYVCPLPRDGVAVHLVPASGPPCHACPQCHTPVHVHLCQDVPAARPGEHRPSGASTARPPGGHLLPTSGAAP